VRSRRWSGISPRHSPLEPQAQLGWDEDLLEVERRKGARHDLDLVEQREAFVHHDHRLSMQAAEPATPRRAALFALELVEPQTHAEPPRQGRKLAKHLGRAHPGQGTPDT
jgi:hypothetical protein